MIIVTGGAGFIGSHLIKRLNERNYRNIIIIDSFSEKNKYKNIHGLDYTEIINYKTQNLFHLIEQFENIDVVFHIGANADVSISDCDKLIHQNYEHSKNWYNFCDSKNIPFIYASSSAVYGNSNDFSITCIGEVPHNEYAFSKLIFDKYVNALSKNRKFQCVGYRFFNVFGPGECYKDVNASLINRFYNFVVNTGKIEIFDDNIHRDYIYVSDLCDVLIKTYEHRNINGIYNLGSGKSWSHLDIAKIVVNVLNNNGHNYNIKDVIEFIKMPDYLSNKFQFYTKATDLNSVTLPFITNTEKRIHRYVEFLIENKNHEN